MEPIAILGAGSLGRETLALIEHINEEHHQWDFIGYFDDKLEKGQSIDGTPVLGGSEGLNAYPTSLGVVVAINQPFAKKRAIEKLTNFNLFFPTLVHPSVHVPKSAVPRIGAGCVIAANTIINVGALIGDFVTIKFGALVGHETVIGNFTSIMPMANVSGDVVVGESCFISVGSTILDGMSLGAGSVVGAGAVVFNAVPPGTTVIGNPARNLRGVGSG